MAFAADEAGAATGQPLRVSIYDNGAHQATVAHADDDSLRARRRARRHVGAWPRVDGARNLHRRHAAPLRCRLRDGARAASTGPLIDQLVRIFAFDVDFQARITPGDTIEVFHSLPDAQDRDAADPEVLFAALTLGGVTKRFYRFRTSDDGVVDYYDEEGTQRQEIPDAQADGRRPDPLRLRLAHSPDPRLPPPACRRRLCRPRGTPIFAAGNGVVEKAGRSSGYGNLTLIKHTNGYETAYGHQSAFAKGVVPGARVRQGQIIGYVGSTGLSTGPHLHFEIRVNAKPVDPLRIRLPRGRVLQAELLGNFVRERDRIDALLGAPANTTSKIASKN